MKRIPLDYSPLRPRRRPLPAWAKGLLLVLAGIVGTGVVVLAYLVFLWVRMGYMGP